MSLYYVIVHPSFIGENHIRNGIKTNCLFSIIIKLHIILFLLIIIVIISITDDTISQQVNEKLVQNWQARPDRLQNTSFCLLPPLTFIIGFRPPKYWLSCSLVTGHSIVHPLDVGDECVLAGGQASSWTN